VQVLVTGGAGFIGANFVHHWSTTRPDDRILVLDALTYAGNAATLEELDAPVELIEGDIADRPLVEEVLRDAAVDVVVNFAAESHNSVAVLDPLRFYGTNVLGTATLLEACRRVGVGRFHHVSTCEVYGDLDLDAGAAGAFTEDAPYRPRTPYNASKAGADHAVRAAWETYGLPVTITNCCNNYGPYQFPEKVIPLFTTLALDDRPLSLYTSLHHRREWLHVEDHCRAVAAVLDGGRLGRTYHVGSGEEATIEEIADGVLEALGKPAALKSVVPDRPGHDRRYLLDSSRIRQELGWVPTIPFDRGLAETVTWYAERRDWWEPLVGRSPVSERAWAAATPGGPWPPTAGRTVERERSGT
jgi:dTDP-glucose 4,6-dehydratase